MNNSNQLSNNTSPDINALADALNKLGSASRVTINSSVGTENVVLVAMNGHMEIGESYLRQESSEEILNVFSDNVFSGVRKEGHLVDNNDQAILDSLAEFRIGRANGATPFVLAVAGNDYNVTGFTSSSNARQASTSLSSESIKEIILLFPAEAGFVDEWSNILIATIDKIENDSSVRASLDDKIKDLYNDLKKATSISKRDVIANFVSASTYGEKDEVIPRWIRERQALIKSQDPFLSASFKRK